MSDVSLHDKNDYLTWRENKLFHYPTCIEQLTVNISNPFALKSEEISIMRKVIKKSNMVIYSLDQAVNPADKAIPKAIARQLGMTHIDEHLCVDEDGVSSLQVSENLLRQDYIPYTNRPINWHTDGYYNTPEHTIRGMVLHCASPAAEGGENAFVDCDIAYLHLRDLNPDYIKVFMESDVMTIPPNDLKGEIIRAEQSGPVFSFNAAGRLHMRYTARVKNIVWRSNPQVEAACKALLGFLNSDSPFVFHHRLQAGQGIISNNVLHKRTGFVDRPEEGKKRLVYRARYYDRID